MTVSAATFTRDFTYGFAELIATATDPTLAITWQTSGPYTAQQVGIFLMTFPADVANQPNIGKAVALTPYPISDDPALAQSEMGLQVRSRAASPDVRDAWAIDDAIADALLGRYSFALPNGIDISTLVRSSSTSLGKDGANRAMWVSNYTANLYRPSQHRQ